MKKAFLLVLSVLVFTGEAQSNNDRVRWLTYLLLISNQHIMHNLIKDFENKNTNGVIGSISFLGLVDPPEVPNGSIYVNPELHQAAKKALNYLVPMMATLIPTISEIELNDISVLQVLYQAISTLQDQVSVYFASQ